MGILDWLRPGDGADEEAADSEMSRRDFFARVAGRAADAVPTPAPPPEPPDPDLLHTFHVAGFPYHDGPVLVPSLRADLLFDLIPDATHPIDPTAVRIQWGRNRLGHVPPEHSAEVRRLIDEGTPLLCRATRVDPTADLAHVLEVEIRTAGNRE